MSAIDDDRFEIPNYPDMIVLSMEFRPDPSPAVDRGVRDRISLWPDAPDSASGSGMHETPDSASVFGLPPAAITVPGTGTDPYHGSAPADAKLKVAAYAATGFLGGTVLASGTAAELLGDVALLSALSSGAALFLLVLAAGTVVLSGRS